MWVVACRSWLNLLSDAAIGTTKKKDHTKMQVEIVKKEQQPHASGEILEFRVNNVESAFANALRRIMLAEIPTLAIEKVTVNSNTSCYHDEMIAHRLGLVPLLSTQVDKYSFPHDCPCGGLQTEPPCEHCQIQGRLRVRCDVSHTSVVVTSHDIAIDPASGVVPMSADPGIWLLTLGRGQEIDVTFRVMKGIAKMHAKYMAVGTVSMQYRMDIRLNDAGLAALPLPERTAWVRRCPAEVFAIDEVSKQVVVERPADCIYCRECLSTEAPFNDLPAPLVAVAPRVSGGRHSVTFRIETTGVMRSIEVVSRAVNILRSKLVRVGDALDEEMKKQGLLGGGGGAVAPPATRGIGIAPTAPIVPNADYMPPDGDDDVIGKKSL
jgi:DNA-directed RNA polymerase II subunit RPB3